MVKCPVCKTKINELDEICPNCKTNLDEVGNKKKSNADILNFMANLNIILSIIGAIFIWVKFSTIEVIKKYTFTSGTYTEKVINWYAILGGVGILIAGFTLFFLLKKVADIYWEVGNNGK